MPVFHSKVERLSGLEELMEDLHYQNKQLELEVAHLKETLTAKEESHSLHLRAYQDTHERQEEQLTLLEARVREREIPSPPYLS